MRGVGSISFQMSSSDVLELSDVLVFGRYLGKNSINLVSYMIDTHWRVSFEGHQHTISDYSLESPRSLDRGVREGGIYRLLVNLLALTHYNERLVGIFISQKAHVDIYS